MIAKNFVRPATEFKNSKVFARIEALDNEAREVSSLHKSCEAKLIDILQELDQLRGYLHYGCTSLFDYATCRLKLSEATASNIIAVARKAVQIPEIKEAIQSGRLSVSKARKITPVITKENKSEWLKLATTSTSREIERAVAGEKPELSIRESAKYKSANRIELKLGVSQELHTKLERIRNLEAQRTKKPSTLEQTLNAMADLYLEKLDPIKKAERSVGRAPKKNLAHGAIKKEFTLAANEKASESADTKQTVQPGDVKSKMDSKVKPKNSMAQGGAECVPGHVDVSAKVGKSSQLEPIKCEWVTLSSNGEIFAGKDLEDALAGRQTSNARTKI